jgi:tetratricopeptide (TPR) repeat protein
MLPGGTVLGIKEPYYKLSNRGGLLLRCDDPSNVEVRLSGWAAAVDMNTALDLKEEGNVHFRRNEHVQACDCYTRGLGCSPAPDPGMMLVLYSNRAAAFNARACFYEAKCDAESALAIDSTHGKSTLRLAHALDQLGWHSAALERLQALPAAGQKVKERIASVKRRLQQSQQGSYDALHEIEPALWKEGNAVIDELADYTGPVEVRLCAGSKGRGLFVTRDVHAGELLFAERVFAKAQYTGPGNLSSFSFQQGTASQANAKSHSRACQDLIGQLLRRSRNAPIDNARLAHLCGGPAAGATPSMSLLLRQCESPPMGIEPCSLAHVIEIVDKNVFAYGTGSKEADAKEHGTGLWILASFMNHDLEKGQGNTASDRTIGPMMFVTARLALKAGTELTTLYFDPSKKELAKSWGF